MNQHLKGDAAFYHNILVRENPIVTTNKFELIFETHIAYMNFKFFISSTMNIYRQAINQHLIIKDFNEPFNSKKKLVNIY